MPTWAKVILVIFAIFVIGFIAVGFVTYRWVRSNKGQFKATMSQGRAFGRDKDATACVDESLRHLGGGSLTAGINARLFAKGCLEVATEPPAFCQSVPLSGEVMATGQWVGNECRRRGIADQSGCMQVLQEVVVHCDAARHNPAGNPKTSN